MVDTTIAPPTRRESDSQVSVAKTTATGFGLAGGADLLMWAFDMIHAEDFIIPTRGEALFLVACLTPFVHLIGRGIMHRLGKWAGDGA